MSPNRIVLGRTIKDLKASIRLEKCRCRLKLYVGGIHTVFKVIEIEKSLMLKMNFLSKTMRNIINSRKKELKLQNFHTTIEKSRRNKK